MLRRSRWKLPDRIVAERHVREQCAAYRVGCFSAQAVEAPSFCRNKPASHARIWLQGCPMMIDRRHFLVAASGLVFSPVLAEEAPPAFAAYERDTGGRIGVYAENLSTGAKIAWRAEERFVMCSTFKASLAAFVLARVDKAEDRLEDMVAYGPKDILDYAPVAKQHLVQGAKEGAMSVSAMCKEIVELRHKTCA